MQKKLNTKLVLFDLDGTLIDTAPDFVLSLNNVLERNNRDTLNFDHIRSFVSEGSVKFTEIGFKINQDDPNFEKYRNEFLVEYKKNLKNKSDLFEGISSVLSFLEEMNILFGIVTNKPLDYAEPLIKHFKELNNSLVLVCPDHLNESKPSPEGILMACEKIGILPKETIYVGDHPNDLIAGMRAGTKTIGCMYGYSLDSNEKYEGSIIINHPKEIIEAIKKI